MSEANGTRPASPVLVALLRRMVQDHQRDIQAALAMGQAEAGIPAGERWNLDLDAGTWTRVPSPRAEQTQVGGT